MDSGSNQCHEEQIESGKEDSPDTARGQTLLVLHREFHDRRTTEWNKILHTLISWYVGRQKNYATLKGDYSRFTFFFEVSFFFSAGPILAETAFLHFYDGGEG